MGETAVLFCLDDFRIIDSLGIEQLEVGAKVIERRWKEIEEGASNETICDEIVLGGDR